MSFIHITRFIQLFLLYFRNRYYCNKWARTKIKSLFRTWNVIFRLLSFFCWILWISNGRIWLHIHLLMDIYNHRIDLSVAFNGFQCSFQCSFRLKYIMPVYISSAVIPWMKESHENIDWDSYKMHNSQNSMLTFRYEGVQKRMLW